MAAKVEWSSAVPLHASLYLTSVGQEILLGRVHGIAMCCGIEAVNLYRIRVRLSTALCLPGMRPSYQCVVPTPA